MKDARDTASVFVPGVKDGNLLAADYVLSHLGISTNKDWSGSYADGNPIWGRAEARHKTVTLQRQKVHGRRQVPDVIGMGARDAVYILESRGLKTSIKGRGKVVKQSVEAGTNIREGMRCRLELE